MTSGALFHLCAGKTALGTRCAAKAALLAACSGACGCAALLTANSVDNLTPAYSVALTCVRPVGTALTLGATVDDLGVLMNAGDAVSVVDHTTYLDITLPAAHLILLNLWGEFTGAMPVFHTADHDQAFDGLVSTAELLLDGFHVSSGIDPISRDRLSTLGLADGGGNLNLKLAGLTSGLGGATVGTGCGTATCAAPTTETAPACITLATFGAWVAAGCGAYPACDLTGPVTVNRDEGSATSYTALGVCYDGRMCDLKVIFNPNDCRWYGFVIGTQTGQPADPRGITTRTRRFAFIGPHGGSPVGIYGPATSDPAAAAAGWACLPSQVVAPCTGAATGYVPMHICLCGVDPTNPATWGSSGASGGWMTLAEAALLAGRVFTLADATCLFFEYGRNELGDLTPEGAVEALPSGAVLYALADVVGVFSSCLECMGVTCPFPIGGADWATFAAGATAVGGFKPAYTLRAVYRRETWTQDPSVDHPACLALVSVDCDNVAISMPLVADPENPCRWTVAGSFSCGEFSHDITGFVQISGGVWSEHLEIDGAGMGGSGTFTLKKCTPDGAYGPDVALNCISTGSGVIKFALGSVVVA